MKTRSFGFAIALVVLILDQLAKWFVNGPLQLEQVNAMHMLSGWPQDRPDIPLVPVFGFTWVENIGISLGLLNATNPLGRWMLVALTAAIAIGVAVWIGREKLRWDQAALGMILGGALGNILDRVRHGYVTDFLDLHFGAFRPFLVFNVGDAAISIGVAILLLRALLMRSETAPKESVENA
jgi:signal peptidase II